MGKLYWYRTGKMYMSATMLYKNASQENININWIDWMGSQQNSLYGGGTTSPFVFGTGSLIASSDTLENATPNDYNYNQIDGVSIAFSNKRYYRIDENGVIVCINQITLTNTATTGNKTVGCIKKTGPISCNYNGSVSARSAQLWAYFFNEPIVLGPNQSFVFDLAMSYETAMDSPEV